MLCCAFTKFCKGKPVTSKNCLVQVDEMKIAKVFWGVAMRLISNPICPFFFFNCCPFYYTIVKKKKNVNMVA